MQLDPGEGGELYALTQATGDIVWHTPHRAATTGRAAAQRSRPQ
jgi:hypothetical protein